MSNSERNPFSQDMEQSNSSRKGWFCTKVVIPLCTGLVGIAAIIGLLYILVAFMAYDPLGFGKFSIVTNTRSSGLSPNVYLNQTQSSIKDWPVTVTTSLEVTTNTETEPTVTTNEYWTTSDAFTTVPSSTVATQVAALRRARAHSDDTPAPSVADITDT